MQNMLTVKKIESGTLLPPKDDPSKSWGLGGVVDKDGAFVEDSIYRFYFGGYYDYDESDVTYNDDEVIYLGHLIPHWGVFFEDFTRRMWYYYRNENPNIKLAYFGVNMPQDGFSSMGSIYHDFFKYADIDESCVIEVTQLTRFKTVYVPQMGYDEDKGVCSTEFLTPFNHIIKNVSGLVEKDQSLNPFGSPKKIYLSRVLCCKNKESGEEIIERFFELNGYKVIYQEQLSLLQKVAVFKEAEIVASIEGATAASVLFAPKVKHQIIIRKQKLDCWRQPWFNKMKGSSSTYLKCYYEPIPGMPYSWDEGPFLMLFNKEMRRFAKENNMQIPKGVRKANFKAIMHYLHIAMAHFLQRHKFLTKAIEPAFVIVRSVRSMLRKH